MASVDAFIRLDSSSAYSMRKTYDEPDIMAEFFGYVITDIRCAGDRVIDVATRVLTQLEGIDKFTKFLGGCFLGVRVFNNDTGVYSVVAAFAQDRLKVLASTIAGFNILGRINEFTKCEVDPVTGKRYVKFLRESSVYKIASLLHRRRHIH